MVTRALFFSPSVGRHASKPLLVIITVALAAAVPAFAQMGGPPSTGMIGGHFLAPPPSVTSVGGVGPHLPPPLPSVTSIPNYGYHYPHSGFNNGYYNGRYGRRGYNGGFAYAVPYYYYPDDSAYGYDYVGNGGPDLYSGPPPSASDPTLHIVVEQPPAGGYMGPMPPPQIHAAAPAPPPPEIKPGEPVVLVFRNGHKQDVTNYAIMGDALYVFDEGRKKIALADLDIAATIKANDDRGLEFRLPPQVKKKATSTVPQSGKPDQTEDAPAPNVAAVL